MPSNAICASSIGSAMTSRSSSVTLSAARLGGLIDEVLTRHAYPEPVAIATVHGKFTAGELEKLGAMAQAGAPEKVNGGSLVAIGANALGQAAKFRSKTRRIHREADKVGSGFAAGFVWSAIRRRRKPETTLEHACSPRSICCSAETSSPRPAVRGM